MGPCDGCHAGCCRSLAVPVTGADLLRIERDRGIALEDSLCRWADPEDRVGRGIAPHFHFADDASVPYVIGLRHVASETHSGTTRCEFLIEEPPSADAPLGRARCGIHESRPLACRTFPAKFNTTGELTILSEPPRSGREEEHPVYGLCPRPWRAEDVDPLELPGDLARTRFERDFFWSVSRLWNEAAGGFEEFPGFLRWVYGNRVLGADVVARRAA